MKIEIIKHDKKRFLDLLLFADEQENMVDRYLERGEMFALYDGNLKSICVVTDEGNGKCEIKNLATSEPDQGKGYGRRLVQHVLKYYRDRFKSMYVGTGDHPSQF